MSSLSPSATRASTWPVAGLMVSKVFPDAASTHFPSISILRTGALTKRSTADWSCTAAPMASPPCVLVFGRHRRPAGAERSTDFPRPRAERPMTGIGARWRRRGGGPTALIVPSTPPPRLLDLVRAAVRLRHLSRRAEKAYVGWIRRFILFHAKRHPIDMGPAEITRFLSALATERNVSASTQNQALSALLFLYRDVPWLDELVRARRPTRLPVVLSRDEVGVVIRELRAFTGSWRRCSTVPVSACSNAPGSG